jgi:hypothetical protein
LNSIKKSYENKEVSALLMEKGIYKLFLKLLFKKFQKATLIEEAA